MADQTAAFRLVDTVDVVNGLRGPNRQRIEPQVSIQPFEALAAVVFDLRDP